MLYLSVLTNYHHHQHHHHHHHQHHDDPIQLGCTRCHTLNEGGPSCIDVNLAFFTVPTCCQYCLFAMYVRFSLLIVACTTHRCTLLVVNMASWHQLSIWRAINTTSCTIVHITYKYSLLCTIAVTNMACCTSWQFGNGSNWGRLHQLS